MTPRNEKRANRAQHALKAYVGGKDEIFENSQEETVDLIVDLLHLAHRQGEGSTVSAVDILTSALGHFKAETSCPDDIELIARAEELGQLQRVVVEVSGGVATVTSCPEGIEVYINDYDDQERTEGDVWTHEDVADGQASGSERPDNIDFVRNLMTFSKYGALAQLFVIDALVKLSDVVRQADPDKCGNALLNGQAWVGVAQEIHDKIQARG